MIKDVDAYKIGKENGFNVSSAKQYYSQNDSTKPKLDLVMSTPYVYDGQNVTARATVDLSDDKKSDNQVRETSMVEFYAGESNLEYSSDFSITDDMRKNVSEYAAAASEHPHVFSFDEYVESRTPVNKRLQLDPPTEQDYSTYLEHVESQLCSRKYEFIGEITKPSEINKAYETLPSFGEMMDEVSASDSFDFER